VIIKRSLALRGAVFVSLVLAQLSGVAAAAETYPPPFPTRPLKIIVGYSAGGAVDIVARSIGQRLATALGQPVIVDNKPGAGTNIAVKALIDSKPDGYTLMLAANALAANMALYQPPPFDTDRDITPVALVRRVPVVIAANADSPYTSLAALVKAAKAHPGAINFATPGNGSTPHMAVELFARTAGISLTHVPYKGGAQAITDVLGGQVPLIAVNAVEIMPHVKSGKLRALVSMSAARSPALPDTPTVAESGYPGFEASVWYAVIAPKGTPKAIVDLLNAEVRKALEFPDVKERLAVVGGEVSPATPEQTGAMIHAERVRYEKLVREANIRTD
jgi:tripartite-type tricarboxylate transporter receptor subunit TctC